MEKIISSYFYKNSIATTYTLNTKLKSKEPAKGKYLSITILASGYEELLKETDGYSAKEIFESPGFQEHKEKKLLKARIENRTVKVS